MADAGSEASYLSSVIDDDDVEENDMEEEEAGPRVPGYAFSGQITQVLERLCWRNEWMGESPC